MSKTERQLGWCCVITFVVAIFFVWQAMRSLMIEKKRVGRYEIMLAEQEKINWEQGMEIVRLQKELKDLQKEHNKCKKFERAIISLPVGKEIELDKVIPLPDVKEEEND